MRPVRLVPCWRSYLAGHPSFPRVSKTPFQPSKCASRTFALSMAEDPLTQQLRPITVPSVISRQRHHLTSTQTIPTSSMDGFPDYERATHDVCAAKQSPPGEPICSAIPRQREHMRARDAIATCSEAVAACGAWHPASRALGSEPLRHICDWPAEG
jgi:hypothetical protein